MKKLLTPMALMAITLLVSCGSKHRGPAYGQQNEFRKQINDSVPVKQWGYTIADVRISEDAEKVLVVFTVPGQTNGVNELVLTNDGFRKYRGRIFNAEVREAASKEHFAASATLQAARRSNTMAQLHSNPAALPVFESSSDTTSSIKSLFESGNASVVVTLPVQ